MHSEKYAQYMILLMIPIRTTLYNLRCVTVQGLHASLYYCEMVEEYLDYRACMSSCLLGLQDLSLESGPNFITKTALSQVGAMLSQSLYFSMSLLEMCSPVLKTDCLSLVLPPLSWSALPAAAATHSQQAIEEGRVLPSEGNAPWWPQHQLLYRLGLH